MQKIFSTFIFGNFWIAIVAIMMCLFTEKALGLTLPDAFLPFVGFATLTSYGFHAYLSSFYFPTKKGLRQQWIAQNTHFLLVQSGISAFLCLFFFFQLKGFTLYILPIAFATFLYSAPQIPLSPFIFLRKIAVGKTLYLSLSWAYVSVLLPLLMGNAAIFSLQNLSFFLNRFLLIYLIAILFDKKDKENDQSLAIKNLITHLSTQKIQQLISICMLLFFGSSGIFLHETHFYKPFFAMLFPAISLNFSLHCIDKTDNDYVYYGYLDGLLTVSTCLFYLI